MTKGLLALHTNKIVHRDLKPSNVLIFDRNVAKLADFGISRELESCTHGVQTDAGRGTLMWMPPEGLHAMGTTVCFKKVWKNFARKLFGIGCFLLVSV